MLVPLPHLVLKRMAVSAGAGDAEDNQVVCTVKIGIQRDMGTLSFPESLLAAPQLVVQPLLLLGLGPF